MAWVSLTRDKDADPNFVVSQLISTFSSQKSILRLENRNYGNTITCQYFKDIIAIDEDGTGILKNGIVKMKFLTTVFIQNDALYLP